MVALLLLVSLAHAAPAPAPADFKEAAAMAEDAIGGKGFGHAILVADALCGPATPGCEKVVRDLQKRHAAQTDWVDDHTSSKPQPATVTSTNGGYQTRPAVFYPAMFDQPTGFDRLASLTEPPAPWSGVKVVDIKANFPDADMICLRKDGVDLPIGLEPIPFAESGVKGTPVDACYAIPARLGQPIWVPDGTLVEIGVYDVRGANIVRHAYECWKTGNFSGRIEEKSPYSCRLVRQ